MRKRRNEANQKIMLLFAGLVGIFYLRYKELSDLWHDANKHHKRKGLNASVLRVFVCAETLSRNRFTSEISSVLHFDSDLVSVHQMRFMFGDKDDRCWIDRILSFFHRIWVWLIGHWRQISSALPSQRFSLYLFLSLFLSPVSIDVTIDWRQQTT